MTKPKSILLIPAVAALITPVQADLILNFTENTGAGTVEFDWEGSFNLAPFVKGRSGVFASSISANIFRASVGNFENYAGPFIGDLYFPVGATLPMVGTDSSRSGKPIPGHDDLSLSSSQIIVPRGYLTDSTISGGIIFSGTFSSMGLRPAPTPETCHPGRQGT